MNSIIQKMLLPILSQFLTDLLSDENIDVYGDKLFDLVEDLVTDSRTKWDDLTVLPVIKQLRKSLGIPDRPD